MIRVLLADDHIMVREALCHLLSAREDIEVVAVAADGREAVDEARSVQPDVGVIDVSMPVMDGIEAARQITALCPMTRVVMLSMYDAPDYLRRALQAGALGYVLKDSASGELVAAVREVNKGRYFFSERLDSMAKRWTTQ